MSASPVRLLGSLAGLPLYRSSLQADPDDNKATAQTVGAMCSHIAAAVSDPVVQASAATAFQRFGNVALKPLRRRAWAVWWFCKHLVKFVQDETLLASMLNEHDQRELLNPPPVMLRMKTPQGDCDDFTMLACSLLKCLGVPFEVVTIAADPNEPERWSHVYAVAVCEDGARIPIDTSHGKYPGWEVPLEHMLRYQAWDESGAPIEGRPSPRSRLNGYMNRGLGARRVMRRRRGLRGIGLGDDDPLSGVDFSGLDTVDTSAVGTTSAMPTTFDQFFGITGDSSDTNTTDLPSSWQALDQDLFGGGSSSSSSGGSSSQTTTALANAANSWTKIFGQLVAPQATVTSGGLTVTGPASTVGSIFSGTSLSSLSSSSLTTLLLLGGAALVLVMVMGGKK